MYEIDTISAMAFLPYQTNDVNLRIMAPKLLTNGP